MVVLSHCICHVLTWHMSFLVLNRIQLKTLSLIDLKDMDVIVWMDYGSVPSTPPPSPEQLEMLFADVDLAIDQGTKMEREECIKEFRDSNSSLPSGIQTWHQYTKCPMHMSLRVSSMMVHLSLWTTGWSLPWKQTWAMAAHMACGLGASSPNFRTSIKSII